MDGKNHSVLCGGGGWGGLGRKTVNMDKFINLQDLTQYFDTTELDKHDNIS